MNAFKVEQPYFVISYYKKSLLGICKVQFKNILLKNMPCNHAVTCSKQKQTEMNRLRTRRCLLNILWTLFYTSIVGYFFFINMETFQKDSIEKTVIFLNESQNITHANVSTKIVSFYII